jgi:uncharacterized protein (DUF983 family)
MIRVALSRGLHRRCPHCGQGPLFSGWGQQLESCPRCGLVYERNSGDTWLFTIIGDRIPIAIIIAAIYFGAARTHPLAGALLFVVAGAGILWTAPNRWGIGLALHYLSRVYFPDPDDPVPPPVQDV